MSYEVKAVEQKDFPISTIRSSKYTVIMNRFIDSQLERASIDVSDITKGIGISEDKKIQTALRKLADKKSLEVEIIVQNKIVFIRKL